MTRALLSIAAGIVAGVGGFLILAISIIVMCALLVIEKAHEAVGDRE